MSSTPLPPWTRRANLSVARHQEIIDNLNASALQTATGGMEVLRTPFGQSLFLPSGLKIDEIFLAKIVATGPEGTEDDYGDERYWARREMPNVENNANYNDQITLVDDVSPETEMLAHEGEDESDNFAATADTVVTAINPGEVSAHSHSLAVNSIVYIMAVFVPQGDGQAKRYLIFSANEGSIWIQIIANTQDGTKLRWKYDWIEVTKSTAGYHGWAPPTGGRSGHSSNYDYAYNTIEDQNDVTVGQYGAGGPFGNGVDFSNLVGTFTVKPVPNKTIVRAYFMRPSTPNADKSPELWFSYENAIDGGCP